MNALPSWLARWRLPKALIAVALLFVLAIITEPVWRMLLLTILPGGP